MRSLLQYFTELFGSPTPTYTQLQVTSPYPISLSSGYQSQHSDLGRKAEIFIANKLSRFDPNLFHILNDVYIPSTGNIQTTQIDHIVVSIYGIFCIETKAHRGWIFGSERNMNWTVTYPTKKYPFHNPLRQNYGHAKSLERLLKDQLKDHVIPLTVFPFADRIMTNSVPGVGNTEYLINEIKEHQMQIYTWKEAYEIAFRIALANIKDANVREYHKTEVDRLCAVVA